MLINLGSSSWVNWSKIICWVISLFEKKSSIEKVEAIFLATCSNVRETNWWYFPWKLEYKFCNCKIKVVFSTVVPSLKLIEKSISSKMPSLFDLRLYTYIVRIIIGLSYKILSLLMVLFVSVIRWIKRLDLGNWRK